MIDFKEIPPGNAQGDEQDIFELFARDFFEARGYEILKSPSRGSDGGRDLIIGEAISGKVTKTTRKWLVSCKHNAHSGSSVSKLVESDVRDRLERHDCDGFVAFYSTIPSSDLSEYFDSIESSTDVLRYDGKRIEKEILADANLVESVARRYFPKSYEKIVTCPSAPVRVGDVVEELNCCCCGKDLMEEAKGVLCLIKNLDPDTNGVTISDIYWACHGDCDSNLRMKHTQGGDKIDLWESVADLSIPIVFVKYFNSWNRDFALGNEKMSVDAADKYWKAFSLISQFVMRETTGPQRERVAALASIPFGYV